MANYDQKNYNKNKPIQTPKPCEMLVEEDYVQRAERVIKGLDGKLTTSQIRNILSMINQLYNDVIMTPSETLSQEVQSQLRYLKVKIIYAAGRKTEVKRFVEASQIDQLIDHIGSSRKNFILYTHYMEALVAYHRFYDGRD